MKYVPSLISHFNRWSDYQFILKRSQFIEINKFFKLSNFQTDSVLVSVPVFFVLKEVLKEPFFTICQLNLNKLLKLKKIIN